MNIKSQICYPYGSLVHSSQSTFDNMGNSSSKDREVGVSNAVDGQKAADQLA